MKPKSEAAELDKLLDFDKLIHERVRLGIMAALSAASIVTFQELKQTLKVTDGNLSIHLKLLAKSNYIVVQKNFVAGKPQSSYSLTETGRQAFKQYVECMEHLIQHLKLE